MNTTKSKTIVYANYIGGSIFLLATNTKPLGTAIVLVSDDADNPVPPAVWITDRQYLANDLTNFLTDAATRFLGHAPDEIHIIINRKGAA